jgi:hypothetical protein
VPESPRWHRVFVLLLALGFLMEAGARFAIHAREGVPFGSLEFYRWSAYGLVRNNPQLASRAFRINNAGMRELEPAFQDKPSGTLRVLVLGGSVAYAGLGRVVLPNEPRVTSGETISQFLENRLREDTRLGDRPIEVLNVAVNFNRIPEVSTAYLAQWRSWDADLVVVMGSANNFGVAPQAGEIENREFGIFLPHPWFQEFEDQVNGTTLSATATGLLRNAAVYSAAIGLMRKALLRILPDAFSPPIAATSEAESAAEPRWADFEEYDIYVREYLSYADAMIAAGRVSGQDMIFFWEYFIAHLDGIRDFNPDERFLYEANRVHGHPKDRDYDFHARDQVRKHVTASGAMFADPLPVLETDPRTIFIDYLHYTAQGNDIMAGVIHQTLGPWIDDYVHDHPLPPTP